MELSDRRRALLEQLRSGALRIASTDPKIPRREPGPFMLSRAQRRVAFVQELYPFGCFNGSLVLSHVGGLDVGRLEDCLVRLVARHDILRTNALRTRDGLVGIVRPAIPINCPITDLSDCAPLQRRETAIAIGREIVGKPFDIFSDNPLLRAAVIRFSRDQVQLILAMHMFVFDAPSGIIFARELAAMYHGLQRGEPLRLDDLDYQYADYIAWSEQRPPANSQASIDYWVAQLAGADAELQLPTDRARSQDPDFSALRHPFSIPDDLEKSLKALARNNGATFYMVMLAALNVLLFRHAGQPTVSIGAWTVSRDARNAHLVGPFVNTIVYKTTFDPDETFSSLLLKVKQQALASYANAGAPFEEIVAAVNPPRDPRINPLFQVHFILQETSSHQAAGGFSLSDLDAHIGASGGYDIELIVRDLQRGVEGHFECNAGLFDEASTARLARRFLSVLAAVAQRPDQRVSTICVDEIASPAATACAPTIALEACLDEMLAADPATPAIVHAGQTIPYGALFARISQIEAWLEDASKSAVLVLACRPGLELCAGMLAALRMGIPFLSLGPAPERATLVALSQYADIIVLREHCEGEISEWLARSYRCAPVPTGGRTPGHSLVQLAPAKASQRAAYLALTSGTTGEPSIVALGRTGLANLFQAARNIYGLDRETRGLQVSDPRHDVAIEEIAPTLCFRGCVAVLDGFEEGVDALTRAARHDAVTHMNLVSSLWESWLNHLIQTGETPPNTLRVITLGSEAVSLSAVCRWRHAFGDRIRLINAYGATEATITSATFETPTAEVLATYSQLPIGRPVPGVKMEVLDTAGAAVPPGIVGELCIGGGSVADGYLVPGTSAGRFIRRDGETWYLTGDRARQRSDGDFEFLGRMNRTFKVRGRFVDLSAIERVLAGRPDVAACVAETEGAGRHRQVVVKVWPRDNRDRREPEDRGDRIRAALTRHLVDAFQGQAPHDRLEIVGIQTARSAEPRTDETFDPLQRSLLELWMRFTGLRIACIDDDLFDLGATSLVCLNVSAGAHAEGIQLTVSDIYARRTIRLQAERVRQRQSDQAASGSERAGRENSHAQAG